MTKGGLHDRSKGVESYSSIIKKLSNEQKEILKLYEKGLTVIMIANKRKTSRNAVYKTLRKIKNKGIVLSKLGGLQNKGGSQEPTNKNKEIYRLHNQRFTIKLISKTQKYINSLKTNNKTIRDNNTVQFYEDNIVIYSNKDFWGSSVDDCFLKSSLYWDWFIKLLENDYNIILLKPRRCHIKDFGCHIAKTNDPLAKEVILRNEKMQVFAPNGNLRLVIDNSFNLKEFEAVDSITATQDMKKIERMYQEIVENDLLSPIEIHNSIQSLIEFQNNNMLMMKGLIKEVDKLKNGR